ncbi:MAG: 3-carboxy-cis,cis-muconate cycloisomerase [Sneathiella sp.]
MSISPFDHPFLGKLLGHPEVEACFSAEEDVRQMLAFERVLAEEQGKIGLISSASVSAIVTAIGEFEVDPEDLATQTAKDGVVVPGLVRQIRKKLTDNQKASLHKGATSQDVIDTSLMLRLKKAMAFIQADLKEVLQNLTSLNETFGDQTVMARTRMQQALPIKAGHKINGWEEPLRRLQGKWESLSGELLHIQLGGAVGDLSTFGGKGLELKEKMAFALGLSFTEKGWHTDRSALSEFASWLAQISTTLGKIGMDIVLMAQTEVGEIELRSAGGSSAMPHKQNPVQAEILVSLARYSAGQLGMFQQAALHENERSGSGWTLEWLILPQMVIAAGAGLRIAGELTDNIKEIRPMEQ